VLDERIMLLGEPPHKELEIFNLPVGLRSDADSSADKDKYLYNVREIVATVTRRKAVIGSLVEYGAKALCHALACNTFRYVGSQSSNIKLIMEKEDEPETMMKLADVLKKSIVPYINVMSTMPHNDDLSILLGAYWDSIKLLQYDGIKSMDSKPYPVPLLKSLDELIGNIDNFLGTYCSPPVEDYIEKIGIAEDNPMIQDHAISWAVPDNVIIKLTLKQAIYMSQIAHSMGIMSMADHLWTSLFFYRGRPLLHINLLDVDSETTSEDASSTSEFKFSPDDQS